MPHKGDLDVGVDEGRLAHRDGLLHRGHDARVHAGQVLGAENTHPVTGALPLHGHAGRQQQVPGRTEWMVVGVLVTS